MNKRGYPNLIAICCIFLTLNKFNSLVEASREYANKPWKRNTYSSKATNNYYSRTDLSSHFLELQEAREDNRARQWAVNLKSRRPGSLSWTSRIAWANILCYSLQVFRPSFTNWGIKLSDRILQGRELYRLITPVFLHGGLGHLFTNMYSLNAVGREVENFFGPGRFLATYVVSGIAGNLVSTFQSPNPSLGASGAVFGIFGAYYVFLSRNEWLLGDAGQMMAGQLVQTIALNVLLGFANPVIDNWGHIGGAIGGAAMAYYFGPRLYLTDLPDGGRIMVDRPIVRLPQKIESIPENCGKMFRRMTRRMQVERYKNDRPSPPWQQRPSYQRPRTPNKSIKPKDF